MRCARAQHRGPPSPPPALPTRLAPPTPPPRPAPPPRAAQGAAGAAGDAGGPGGAGLPQRLRALHPELLADPAPLHRGQGAGGPPPWRAPPPWTGGAAPALAQGGGGGGGFPALLQPPPKPTPGCPLRGQDADQPAPRAHRAPARCTRQQPATGLGMAALQRCDLRTAAGGLPQEVADGRQQAAERAVAPAAAAGARGALQAQRLRSLAGWPARGGLPAAQPSKRRER
jgi:hypothetical protein